MSEMSAPNPNPGEREFDALRRAQRAHEPSMEEILASIRAIIADDREASGAPTASQFPVQPAEGCGAASTPRIRRSACAPIQNSNPPPMADARRARGGFEIA